MGSMTSTGSMGSTSSTGFTSSTASMGSRLFIDSIGSIGSTVPI